MQALSINSFKAIASPNTPHLVRSVLMRGSGRLQSPLVSIKLVLAGEERFAGDRRAHAMRPGAFLLTAPDQPLEVSVNHRARGLCLYLDPQRLKLLAGQLCATGLAGGAVDELSFWTAALPLDGSAFGQQLRQLVRSGRRPDEDSLSIALVELLVNLNRQEQRLGLQRPAARRELLLRLERARAYILAHANGALSLDGIAREARLSRYHLVRSFAQIYGEPPLRFHQNLRLDAARQRLQAGESASALAREFGFASVSSFSRAYLRRHRRRPGADRSR